MNIAEEMKRNTELIEYKGEDQMVLAQEMYDEIKRKGRPQSNLKSKIPAIDEILGGFFEGQLVVISGTSGHGKTTLAQSFTMAFAEDSIKSSWFSYEVETEDFLEQFSPTSLKHFYLPAKMTARTTKWIEDRICEASLKYGSHVVFIDHLHYLMDFHKTNNISFDIGSICRNLKNIAKEQRIVIFLICHTTKTNPERELDLGDVRDSSFIEQEADAVLYLWRDKTNENGSVVKIAKNRKRGKIGNIIGLEFRAGRYYERAGFSESDYRIAAGNGVASGQGVGRRKKGRVSETEDDRWNY